MLAFQCTYTRAFGLEGNRCVTKRCDLQDSLTMGVTVQEEITSTHPQDTHCRSDVTVHVKHTFAFFFAQHVLVPI